MTLSSKYGFLTVGVATSVVLFWWQNSRKRRRTNANLTASTFTESSNDDCIYMDYNGTTPVYPFVVDAMLPYFQQHYGNPSSSHSGGDAPRAAVDAARRKILTFLLGCDVDHDKDTNASTTPLSACIFTACGTESDNLAIHLALQTWKTKNGAGVSSDQQKKWTLPHIVATNVEHPAVDLFLALQEQEGKCTVTRVPVQSDGCVATNDMIAAIQPNTYVVSKSISPLLLAPSLLTNYFVL
jgi:cysteine desulfurase